MIFRYLNTYLAKVEKHLNPRRQFNNWSRSQAGQTWKEQQFKSQQGKCARCNKRFDSLADAETHHVRSLHDLGR